MRWVEVGLRRRCVGVRVCVWVGPKLTLANVLIQGIFVITRPVYVFSSDTHL